MKVYNNPHQNLTPALRDTLNNVRKLRGFDLNTYIQAKSNILNNYMRHCGLNACVVAISGGIDSAAVLSLVAHAQKQPNSPIKKIVAVTIPSFDGSVTNQQETVKKAMQLGQALNIDVQILDITKPCTQLAQSIEHNLEQTEDPWSRGQLVSYVRTPSLYYYTTVLNAQGFRPILVGTINRDEGAYLGYLCKSGDGCVDVQLISDAHKSEVYTMAHYLKVPESILNAAPNGDMFDGRIDEEVFGAPYDFVEMFLAFKSMTQNTRQALCSHWKPEDYTQFETYSNALEKLHRYNAHKYLGGSTAIHLDVMSSAVTGGWIEGVHTSIHKNHTSMLIQTHRFVGFIPTAPKLGASNMCYQVVGQNIKEVKDILSLDEREKIQAWIKENHKYLVRTNTYGYPTQDNQSGSLRLSFYDEEFAKVVFERLLFSGAIKPLRICKDDKTNWKPYEQWRAIGLNPLFRIMKYEEGTTLNAHYDDSFYQNETRRSLMSVVLIVKKATQGGATRFIQDKQDSLVFESRDFSDWNYPAPDELVVEYFDTQGSGLVFDHRMLHDGQMVIEGEKIIMRTDVIYECCDFLVE